METLEARDCSMVHSTRNQAREDRCKQLIPHDINCCCEPCEGRSVLDKWHVAGVGNIPPTALRLTDDPDASWMWTLEIKRGVFLMTLCASLIKNDHRDDSCG
ncbi:TPA: hypothetical protein ACH3X2_000458 [Trebouxia sp. C0005]